jgi:sugar-specific transcriptional regulator TrmB
MVEEILSILEEYGLSDKEAKVYLALLELGQSNVTRLADRSEINRVTTYHILESLSNKGIVKSIKKDKIQNFLAVEPKILISLLKEKENKLKSILKELEEKVNLAGKKPYVELYEGKKGMTSMLDFLIDNYKDEVLAYGNFDIVERSLEYQSLHWRKKRLSKNIKMRAITDRLEAEFIKESKWKKLTEFKILKNLGKTSTWTFISGDLVCIITAKKDLTGVLIENEEIAEAQRIVFNLLWKIAEF